MTVEINRNITAKLYTYSLKTLYSNCNRDAPIQNFCADTDIRLLRMIFTNTDS